MVAVTASMRERLKAGQLEAAKAEQTARLTAGMFVDHWGGGLESQLVDQSVKLMVAWTADWLEVLPLPPNLRIQLQRHQCSEDHCLDT
jgi:hypothetical protein